MNNELTEQLTEIEKVIPIDPHAKYVLVIHERLASAEMASLTDKLKAWWDDPERHFLIIDGRAELQKIDA